MTVASAFLFLEIIQQILLCPPARRVNLRRNWLRHCGTSQKVAGFSPIGSFRFYIQLTLGSTQPIAEMSTTYIFGGSLRGAVNLAYFLCQLSRNRGSLSLLEHYGPVLACTCLLHILFLLPNVSKKVKLRFRLRTVQLVCIARRWKGSSEVSTLLYRKRQIE